MHSPRSAVGKGGTEPPTKFSKSGSLKRPQLVEVNCWEREGDFFQGVGCNFHIKNKLKSENLMSKKVYKQKFFSVITKNSKWGILTKNLVIFKR